MKTKTIGGLVFSLLLSLPCALAAQTTSSIDKAALGSITEAELRDHIYFLASDYMKGRVGPSAEYEIAAQYAASQFAAAGLKALESETGNMNGYFQEVPFRREIMDEQASWVLSTRKGEMELHNEQDFKLIFGNASPKGQLEVVFAGYGISEAEAGWDDMEGLDLEGKMVFLLDGTPKKDGVNVLPDSVEQRYSGRRSLQSKIWPMYRKKAAAVVIVADKVTEQSMPYGEMTSSLSEERYIYTGKERSGGFPMIMLMKGEAVQQVFKGQGIDPTNYAMDGVGKKYRSFELKNVSMTANFPLKEDEEVFLKNVVAVVEGTDPDLKGEYITVGAHLDHVALGSGEVANGADDNASGSAGVMEIAEAVAMNPPRRSVVFITYTAEEMGLHGSHYFVNSGPLAIDQIKFNVNLDMIGRTTQANMDTRAQYVRGKGEYGAALEPFIASINDATIKWPLLFEFGDRMSGSSDHASFSAQGIPAFYLNSGRHEDLHRATDDPEKIEYDKAEAMSRLAYLVTMELANMDEVPLFREQKND